MMHSANWNYPTPTRVGAGRINELPDICRAMKIRYPLIITDPGLAALPIIDKVSDHLRVSGLNSAKFIDIQSNPTGENIEDGVDFYHINGHDGIIAIGGGSALDAAKAVGLMVGQNRPIWDFEDVGDNWTRVITEAMAPVIAIPTTAGTGSEMGRAAVITDQERKVKKIIFHANMLPGQVILDPELTTGLPPLMTAATGMDALSHNLEALCSPFYHPMAEGIAVQGIRMVDEFLPRAFNDGTDIEARLQMLVCSSMGATAFQKGLGGMHALAHPLGALYNAHHGTLNAILMPYVLLANQNEIAQRITRLTRYMGFDNPGFDSFLDWVLQLRKQLGISHTLAKIGINNENAALIGKMAVEDPSAGGNPINFSATQYERIFTDAVSGNL